MKNAIQNIDHIFKQTFTYINLTPQPRYMNFFQSFLKIFRRDLHHKNWRGGKVMQDSETHKKFVGLGVSQE